MNIDDIAVLIQQLKVATARNQPVRIVSGFTTMADDATMYVVCSESPRTRTHWMVLAAGVIGTAQLSPVDQVGSPLCGLFEVQANVKPEPIAVGALATGFYPGADLNNRGLALPCVTTSPNSGSDGTDTNSPAFFFRTTLDSPQPLPVPYGQTLAGIYTPNPGQAQPGPGAGSRASLWALICEVEESSL